MRKLILLISIIGLTSFNTQDPKKITVEFTPEELQVVYDALGELPAKTSEGIRTKIILAYRKAAADSINKK